MVLEELAFGLEGNTDLLVRFDVSLSSVHHGNVTQSQRNDPSRQDINNVSSDIPIPKMSVRRTKREQRGSRAHKINLGQDTNRPRSLRVDFSRQLQPIRVRQILVARRDRQNDATRLRDILKQHISDLLLDILRLITDRHLGDTGQIDEGQREDVWRVDSEVDRDGRDSSIATGLGFSVFYDLLSNLVEIMELFAWEVEEFTPLIGVNVLVGVIWTSSEKLDILSPG